MATVGPISQYDILRKLARGGMGEVYLARQTGIEGFAKEVVLKRIHANYAENPQFVKMFLQEARVAALLDHPNIVQIYELGKHGPDYFIVMEYVKGLSLSRLIKASGGPIPHPFAIQVAAGVAAGLQFAHEKKDSEGRLINLVHRDISPPNVLLSTSGSVKITDFGIAKMRDSVTHTQVGVIKGKYSYISPEQARGEQATIQSDIYSLGLVLYEMTTGVRAYPAGNDKEVLKAVSQGQLPPPELHMTNFPEDLRGVLMRALETDNMERYTECQELQEDLLSLLVHRRIVTSPAKLGNFVEELMVKLEGDDVPSPRRNTLESIKMENPMIQTSTLGGLGRGQADTGTDGTGPTADLQPDPPTARTPIQALGERLGPDSLVDLDHRDDPSISTDNDEVSTATGGSSFPHSPTTTRTSPMRGPDPLQGLPTSPDVPVDLAGSESPALNNDEPAPLSERDRSSATVETPAFQPMQEERDDPSQPRAPAQSVSPVVEMPADEPIGADDFDEDADTIMVDRSNHLDDELDSSDHEVEQELVLDPMAMHEAEAASSSEEPDDDEQTSAFDDKTDVSENSHDMNLLGAMSPPSSEVVLEDVAAATAVDGNLPSAFEDHDSQQGPDPRVQELGPGSLTGATGEVQAGRKRGSSLPWIVAVGLVVVLGAGATWFFGFKEETPEVGVNAATSEPPKKPPKKPPVKPPVKVSTKLDAGTKVAVAPPTTVDAAAAPMSVDASTPDRGIKPDSPAPPAAVKKTSPQSKLSRRQRIRLARQRRARAQRRRKAREAARKAKEAARMAKEAARKSAQPKRTEVSLSLSLTTTPRAEVLFRGKSLGKTPLKAKIPKPKGKLTLSFQNKAVGLNVRRTISGGGTHIATRFIFRKGILGIQVPGGSSVYLDGKKLGRAPIKPRLVYEGRHIVVVKRKGSRLMKTFRPVVRPMKTTWVTVE
jgi:serine/threonine protein kinase